MDWEQNGANRRLFSVRHAWRTDWPMGRLGPEETSFCAKPDNVQYTETSDEHANETGEPDRRGPGRGTCRRLRRPCVRGRAKQGQAGRGGHGGRSPETAEGR